jgi:hypothetical protein
MRNPTHETGISGTSQSPALLLRPSAIDQLTRLFVAAVKAVSARLREAKARFQRRADARASYRALCELDVRTLHDLGMHRSELRSVALEVHGEIEPTRIRRGPPTLFPNRSN